MTSINQDTPAEATSNPAKGRNPYYAAAYFSPYYFYGSSLISTPVASNLALGRDSACYAALVALLDAIGSFDAVIFGDPTLRPGAGASSHPLAIVIPKGWEEADETDPILCVRRVLFTIRVTIRVEDDTDPFSQLDQLAATVQSRVDRADLGGQCLPPLSRIRAGRYAAPSHYPEWSIDLDGEFAVLVNSSADS